MRSLPANPAGWVCIIARFAARRKCAPRRWSGNCAGTEIATVNQQPATRLPAPAAGRQRTMPSASVRYWIRTLPPPATAAGGFLGSIEPFLLKPPVRIVERRLGAAQPFHQVGVNALALRRDVGVVLAAAVGRRSGGWCRRIRCPDWYWYWRWWPCWWRRGRRRRRGCWLC